MSKQDSVTESKAILIVENASYEYRAVRKKLISRAVRKSALGNASMTISSGDAIGIVGSSGAGKTTFARILSGQLVPSSGVVSYLGTDLQQMSNENELGFRRGVQYVFQNPRASFDPRLKLGDSLLEPLKSLKILGNHQNIINQTLIKVGLDISMIDRFSHELSGGQLQRMAIARALVVKPKVLIADEPSSSLDVSVRAQILNLFKDLTDDEDMALILIAHDLAAVAYTTKQIVVFSAGGIVEQGSVSEVLFAPKHKATADLIDASIGI